MTDWIQRTEDLTRDRFDRETDRALRTEGHGATAVSLKITERALPNLVSIIDAKLSNLQDTLKHYPSQTRTLLRMLKEIPTPTIALCSLHALLTSIGRGEDMRRLGLRLGTALSGEFWAVGLLKDDGKLAARISRVMQTKHARVKERRQAARSMAAAAGYTSTKWSKGDTLRAGTMLADWTIEALPEVFYVEAVSYGVLTPFVHQAALDDALALVGQTVAAHPANQPCTDPPLPWTGLHVGGYPDARLKGRITFLRNHTKIQGAMARNAIHAGSMLPAMDAVNAVQSVPFKINRKVLAVMLQCERKGIAVPGLPRPKPYPLPPRPRPWPDMSENERKAWRRRADKIEQTNRGLNADRMLHAADTSTAKLLAHEERFFTPYNADWRGRVYPLPHFNFQRSDTVRGLFLFADGAPIGTDGLRWLKIHCANCGGFDGVDKRSLEERIAWIDENMKDIVFNAANPILPFEGMVPPDVWWTKASEPFLFLAACMEIAAAIVAGPTFVTHLPVSFDGSCSGLQHLGAMTRDDKTATLVNLTSSPTRHDIYQTVADEVQARMTRDLTSDVVHTHKGKPDIRVADLAQLCLSHGISRNLVKRNVMTFAYSSKKYGMSHQHQEDTMRPLETKVLAGELAEHPFAINEDNGRAAAKYLAGHCYDAICALVSRPAQAMGFLQDLARVMAHEGKPLRWTTPAGLPWANAYYVPNYTRVKLWLHNSSVTMKLAEGNTKEVDKNAASNGVAPNFVHACDAAHLMLTVNAAVRDGIRNIATVHDSFGCLAPAAARFNEIIREAFVDMYTQHDVLAEVLEQAKCDLNEHNWHRLPECVDKGSLNINEVLNAQFAFA